MPSATAADDMPPVGNVDQSRVPVPALMASSGPVAVPAKTMPSVTVSELRIAPPPVAYDHSTSPLEALSAQTVASPVPKMTPPPATVGEDSTGWGRLNDQRAPPVRASSALSPLLALAR